MRSWVAIAAVSGLLALSAPAMAEDVARLIGDVSSAIAKSRRDFAETTRRLARAYDIVRKGVEASEKFTELATELSDPIWESVDFAEDAAYAYRQIKPKPLKPLTSRESLRGVTSGWSEIESLPGKRTIVDGEAAIAKRKGEIAELRSLRRELDDSVAQARRESDDAIRLGQELKHLQEHGGANFEIAVRLATGKSFALDAGGFQAFVEDAYATRVTEGERALKRLSDVVDLAEKDLLDFDVFIATLKFRDRSDPLDALNSSVEKANPYGSPRRVSLTQAELAAMEARQERIFERVEKLRSEADAIDQHNGRLEEMRRIVAGVGAVAGAVGANSEASTDKAAAPGVNGATPAPSASVPTAGVAAPKATIPVNRPATPTTPKPVPLDPLPEQPPVRLRDLE